MKSHDNGKVSLPCSESFADAQAGNIEEISSFNDRGLFVGGCPKSGTTLLLTLLDSHPQLVVFPTETHYLDESRKYRALKGYSAKLRHLLERSELQSIEHGEFETDPHGGNAGLRKRAQFDCDSFARLAAQFANREWINDSLLLSETIRAYASAMNLNWRECVRWVEKTPSNVPRADDLFRLFPECKNCSKSCVILALFLPAADACFCNVTAPMPKPTAWCASGMNVPVK